MFLNAAPDPASVTRAASVRAALARGHLLGAYDEVVRRPDISDPELNYLEVLTLACLGDAERGLKLYDDYGLAAMGGVDALSLKARLLTHQAFDAPEPVPHTLLRACRLYAEVFRRTKSSHPAISAATLAKIAGRPRLASMLARQVVAQSSPGVEAGYSAWATRAEALAVLGDVDGAKAALQQAIEAPDANVEARSTTMLQLRRLVAAGDADHRFDGLLGLIEPPKVAMFCGNIFVGSPDLEAHLAARMRAVIARESVGFGYGALAAGSDMLIAELLLEAGAELHVVLPFAEPDFLEQSVAPAGEGWVARYQAVRAKASSMTYASNMSSMGGMAQYAYGSKVTMGMARLRARQLHAEALQLVIVEERGDRTLTGSDVTAWRNTGGRAEVVIAPPLTRPVMPAPPEKSDVERGVYGLIFADYPGFSKLDERVLQLFWEDVMVRAAEVLRQHGEVIRSGNTWGDTILTVFQNASAAAQAALDLCEQLKKVNCSALGAREGAAMRIALHHGPNYSGYDPVTRGATYYGTEVSRAAPIEPVTPSGAVYVTEPFAAVLEMEDQHPFECDYVGKIALPKGYGIYPLYRLSGNAAARKA